MPVFFDNALLAALVDRQSFDASSLAAASTDRAPPSFETMVALCRRLPTGLVYADEIYVLPEAPPGFEPLAPGSAWYARDRTLLVAMPGGVGLEALLADLGAYYRAAHRVHERLAVREDLVTALDGTHQDGLAWAEIAMMLDALPKAVAAIDAALKRDLAAMGRRAFDPVVHVHADLTPAEQIARGRAIAESLLARVPRGTFMLAVADDESALESLSPYTRDLGHALYAWTLENPDAIRTRGLVDAIKNAPDEPNDDLASLVVAELFRDVPELRAERREQEATQGLWIDDSGGLAYGIADLSQLAAPDPRLFAEPKTGTIVVLAGGAPIVSWAAAKHLIESARVSALVGIFGGALDDDRPVIAPAIVSDDDAIRFGSTKVLVDLAAELELGVTQSGPIPAGFGAAAPPIAMHLFETVRRNRVLGSIDPETAVYLVLYSARSRGLSREKSRLEAARLGFKALLTPPAEKAPSGRKGAKSEKGGRPQRRFRA